MAVSLLKLACLRQLPSAMEYGGGYGAFGEHTAAAAPLDGGTLFVHVLGCIFFLDGVACLKV